MTPKETKILAGIISVAILVAGFLYANKLREKQVSPPAQNQTQSSLETAGWRTYRNEEYGFEVKYPKNWEEDRSFTTYSVRNLAAFQPIDLKAKDGAMVEFIYFKNKENLSLKDFFTRVYENCRNSELACPGSENPAIWKEISLGGVSALRTGKRSGEGPDVDTVNVKTDGYVIQINALYTAGYRPGRVNEDTYDLAPTFDQILSTFKFTK